ncbi:MAG: hypothetical protein HY236_04410 [Acidobacteria bacterium]|nr:hypothetical protein [Acidobacteriota bacterium]
MPGGLYPDGANKRPAAHEAAGFQLAASVRPRDWAGANDQENGKIVLLSIGMSNTTMEFSVFKSLADADPQKNPRLVIVDGAQDGWSADRIVSDGAPYWTVVEERLRAAGASPAQVQVIWLKEADARPTPKFPDDARRLQAELRLLAQTIGSHFASLRLLYLSSRIYGGYASTDLNPEPYAYQSGFAVKWLIEQQIQGDPALRYSSGQAPWMAWGPYLWADGTQARRDGLVWACSDFEDDGTHPSPSGREKVARMLLDFFKSDTTARPWFVRPSVQPPPTPQPAALVNGAGFQPQVASGSIATLFGTELADAEAWATALPLPLILGDTRVEVGGEPALLLYVSPRQINLVMPAALPGTDVVVIREGVRSNPLMASLSLYAPGLFSLSGTGQGPAAALHADGRLISPQDPARHGEIIELFATGFGVRNPLSLRPDFLPIGRIGGALAAIDYSGPAPGFPGLNQVNLTVPAQAPLGAEIPVLLQLASIASNTVSLAVAAAF